MQLRKKHKPITLMLLLLALLYFIYSCKRDDISPATPAQGTVAPPQTDKVNEWLTQEETHLSEDRPARVERLRGSLDFASMYTEPMYDQYTLLIVPVKKGFVTENSKNKDPMNSLVLQLDASGKIVRGKIFQYLPALRPANGKMPPHFFHDFYNGGVEGMSGKLTFLSVAGELQAEETRDKGKLVSHSEVQRKGKDGNPTSLTSLQCWDVWWVTYYADGTSTWDYLYSYCDNEELPCLSALQSKGKTYFVACDGGGGNGGEEPEMFRQLAWRIWTSDDHEVRVSSYENVRGKRTGPGTGYFTHISHVLSGAYGDNQSYTETGNVVTNGTTYVSSEVAGEIIYDHEKKEVHNEHTWMFSDVF